MFRLRHLIPLLLLGVPWMRAYAQDAAPTSTPAPATQTRLNPQIVAPAEGDALQGAVQIMGTTAIEGYQSARLSFAYSGQASEAWFLIREDIPPLEAGQIAEWDTNTITDGEYDLELVVVLANGNIARARINRLRVRNYTPVETNTPTPATPTATQKPEDTPIPTLTPTVTQTQIPPSATPLPPNPVEISEMAVLTGMGKGALAVVGFFALMGIYAYLRRIVTRR